MIIYEIPLQLTPISLNIGRKLKTQIHAFTKTLSSTWLLYKYAGELSQKETHRLR